MEPFTFIMVDHYGLFELRWDENEIHFSEKNKSGYHIWSSSTLYPPEIRAKRNKWFQDWLKFNDLYSLDAIQYFHQYGGEADDWNGFVMNRNNIVQTVSITNVIKENGKMSMIYNDLIRKKIKTGFVKLNENILSPQG